MFSRFKHGFSTPFRGFAYLQAHKHLWPFVLPAALVSVFITGAALLVLVVVALAVIGVVHPLFGGGFWAVVLEVLVIAALGLVVIAITLLLWLLLQNIISGHLLSKLAARVEKDLGIDPSEIAAVPFKRQVTDGALDTGLVLGINAAGLAVQLVPGIGTLVGVPLVFAGDALVFGSDFINHPMNLRGMSFRQRQAFIRRHLPETLGIGAAVMPLGLVPIVGGLVTACTVVGAVLLYRELTAEE